ncbi:MAG: glycosyltransferase, partial [Ignisphaera sp.]
EKALRLGIAERVKFLVNVSDIEKWNILMKSKIIVHAKIFEPFGIAVAEGMYAGCIPVVFRGPLSGPWIDLTNKGEFGFGFRDVDALADIMDNVLADYDKMKAMVNDIATRALAYSYESFRKRFLTVIAKQLV